MTLEVYEGDERNGVGTRGESEWSEKKVRVVAVFQMARTYSCLRTWEGQRWDGAAGYTAKGKNMQECKV